jgi:multidrug efflux system membrane fusion protein
VRSRYETPLAFRIPGKITARLVDAGAVVKAGQVLARIDPADSALSAAAAAQLNLAPPTCSASAICARRTSSARRRWTARKRPTRQRRRRPNWRATRHPIPCCGRSGGRDRPDLGEVGQVVAAGQTVMRLARADTLEVAIAIPEARMPEVRALGAAEVTPVGRRRGALCRALRELSPVADPVTRTYAARVSIDRTGCQGAARHDRQGALSCAAAADAA